MKNDRKLITDLINSKRVKTATVKSVIIFDGMVPPESPHPRKARELLSSAVTARQSPFDQI